MKLINTLAAFILTAFILAWTTACQTNTGTQSGNLNGSVTNTNTTARTATNTNQAQAAKTEAASPTDGGSLATPTDTYKTGYAARQKKDIAGLKRVFSKEALEFLTEVGKAEQKTLEDQLTALAEKPQSPSDETRNEKINGNRASLEYLNERGGWAPMEFTKEGNDWKIDLPKAR